MNIEQQIAQGIAAALGQLFQIEAEASAIALQPTKKEFVGDYTLVVFPYTKSSKKNPEETARLIGEHLRQHVAAVADFNVVKGFLNIVLSQKIWIETLAAINEDANYGSFPAKGRKVMVEYSSPNTNKPLHLGHLRNNFLGYSVAQIMKANGYEVMKTQVVNDRGIHICKSMLAYKRFGQGESPESSGMKGDHLAGHYYVVFDKENKRQAAELFAQYQSQQPDANPDALKEKAANDTELMQAARQMLVKWEQGDADTVALWRTMNQWVYDGFNATYRKMGVDFDKIYYESETYLLGKKIVDEGLERGLFFRKPDGSVWIDLTADGLDQKLLLRSDGTSVYITQDFGLADMKFADFPMEKSVYVVGNEQDYHFKVLKLVIEKLGRSYAPGIYHLSYGMVELPSGKMKSREGTVVDADDLMAEMEAIARERTIALGKIEDFESEEAEALYHQLAMGALKYYLLRVDPKKKMLFNPEESIDFQGDTGVYIQYMHARIAAIVRRAHTDGLAYHRDSYAQLDQVQPVENELVQALSLYPKKVQSAGAEYSPATIASYAYDTARIYSRFYNELSIFNEADAAKRSFRVALSAATAKVIKHAMHLIGIEVPERM